LAGDKMIIKEVNLPFIDSKKIVLIAGIRECTLNVKFDELVNKIRNLKNRSTVVQFFNADFIAGWQHIFFSVINAYNSFDQKRNISNKIEAEILLYVSAQRQIKNAINLFGINTLTRNICVVIIADTIDKAKFLLNEIQTYTQGTLDDNIIEIYNKDKFERIKQVFNISLNELKAVKRSEEWADLREALTKSIISRAALLVSE